MPAVVPECSPVGTQVVLEVPSHHVDHVVEVACRGRARPSAASSAKTLALPPGSKPSRYGVEPPQCRCLAPSHVEVRGADDGVEAARDVCRVYSTTRQMPEHWEIAATRPLLLSRSAPSNSLLCCSGMGSVQEGGQNLRGPGQVGRLRLWGGE